MSANRKAAWSPGAAGPLLGEVIVPESWMDDALCAEIGGDHWHPDPGGAGGRAAKMICRRCPVTAECLEYGFNDPFGIYGGFTADERKQMRRKQREAA